MPKISVELVVVKAIICDKGCFCPPRVYKFFRNHTVVVPNQKTKFSTKVTGKKKFRTFHAFGNTKYP